MIGLVSFIILGLSAFVSSSTSTSTPVNSMTRTFIVDRRQQQQQRNARPSSSDLLFGIRGGGLFGGKDDAKSESSPSDTGGRKTYPPMTQEEVEDWLEHIPVYAVTDSNGAGVVLKPDDDTSVFYFFLSPLAANATLTQLKSSNEEMDLKVSAFSLGKIWFKLLNSSPDQEVMLKAPGDEDGEGTATRGVEYRLVPDTRDLLGARMLLTMNPEDGEKLKNGESMTPEMAQKAIEKAMTESPKFKGTFNEIPVFTIAQMRMQKQNTDGQAEEATTLLPMYFSLQNMVGTWQAFMAQSDAPPEAKNVEPAINLLSLHDLVDLMMAGSEIDFKSVVLVPPVPEPGPGPSTMGSRQGDSSMGGGPATLGDI